MFSSNNLRILKWLFVEKSIDTKNTPNKFIKFTSQDIDPVLQLRIIWGAKKSKGIPAQLQEAGPLQSAGQICLTFVETWLEHQNSLLEPFSGIAKGKWDIWEWDILRVAFFIEYCFQRWPVSTIRVVVSLRRYNIDRNIYFFVARQTIIRKCSKLNFWDMNVS